tara:strand:+ start:513 stop:1052 length:540 start_codon:yes stop_codon:yes gene_type:complete
MAESFTNSLGRAVGVVTSTSVGAIGIQTNKITGISTVGLAVSSIVDNQHYIAGTKVASVGTAFAVLDRDSTNTVSASSQSIKFLGVTTSYTSIADEKAILIGGTFANNTNNQVNLTVTTYDASSATEAAIASKIPVPYGSSFVIADTGKTLLEGLDEVRVYCDTANAIDVNLSILKGVS